MKQGRRRWSWRAFVRLGRAFPPALPTLARVPLQRLSPIGNSRNPPPRAENAANFSGRARGRRGPENAANFFRSSTRAAGGLRIKDVTETLQIPSQSINALMQYLKRKHLVEKTGRDPHAPYSLTEMGHAALAEMTRRQAA